MEAVSATLTGARRRLAVYSKAKSLATCTKVELFLNLNTGKELGITVPMSDRADELIEWLSNVCF